MKDIVISNNKQLAINLSTAIVAFFVNLLINFFLSPYIVKTIGVEANGYISLANNFITYVTLVTIALNSMAGRFITFSIHKHDFNLANKYYNAVLVGNLIIVIMLLFPAIFMIYKLEHFIQIPSYLIKDVKLLFSMVFINFFILTGLPNWYVATFATNKVYLNSYRTMQSNILKLFSIILLFIVFSPHVYFVGIATLISSLYIRFFEYYYHKKLLPKVKISFKFFELKYVIELLQSGIWNTVNQAGQLLLSGLDLLIANIFIGPVEMGLLSLAKTLPTVITGLAGTINGVFSPKLTIDYAKEDRKALENSLKQGMKITGIILTIPLTLLIIYGKDFYKLWVPTEDAQLLQILSVLTCFGYIFTSGIQCLYNVFTVTNKLKLNSLMLLFSGVLSTVIVIIILKISNLGVFAIAGVSSCVNLIRNLCYTVPAASKYLGLQWYTFFPEVIMSICSVIIVSLVGYLIKLNFFIDSWMKLTVACILTCLLGLIINIVIVLNKDEKKIFFKMIKNKLKLI